MATLADLADWMATAPEGTELRYESPGATDEMRQMVDTTMERIAGGELLTDG